MLFASIHSVTQVGNAGPIFGNFYLLRQYLIDYRYIENMNGIADPKKPLITSYSALKVAILAITDTPFLTKMQKRENRADRFSP